MKIVISKSRIKKWWNGDKKEKHINCKDCKHWEFGTNDCSVIVAGKRQGLCRKNRITNEDDWCFGYYPNHLGIIKIIKRWFDYNAVIIVALIFCTPFVLLIFAAEISNIEFEKQNPIIISQNGRYVGYFYEYSEVNIDGCIVAKSKNNDGEITEQKICGDYVIEN